MTLPEASMQSGRRSEQVPNRVGRLRLLVVAGTYPYAARPQTGIFTQRCVEVLREVCGHAEVLVPRPYVPRLLSRIHPRWATYSQMPPRGNQNGVSVIRPGYLQIPLLGGSRLIGLLEYASCRRAAWRIHRSGHFDAILAFDVVTAAGLAWRIARSFGVPVAAWALGGDVRASAGTERGRAVAQTLGRLDLVFYQSSELKGVAADLLGLDVAGLAPDRHVVLPHGIPAPPAFDRNRSRAEARRAWGFRDEDIVVLYHGRMLRSKGIGELLRAFSSAAAADSRLACVLVGSSPGFDETDAVRAQIRAVSLGPRVKMFPVRPPERIWDELAGADIFAFPSHNEGMPNSLLEAMAMSIPAVAFGIPPVQEIEAGTGALSLVPPFDEHRLADAILKLAASSTERQRLGEEGRRRVFDGFMVRNNVASAADQIARLVEVSRPSPGTSAALAIAGRVGPSSGLGRESR